MIDDKVVLQEREAQMSVLKSYIISSTALIFLAHLLWLMLGDLISLPVRMAGPIFGSMIRIICDVPIDGVERS